MAAWEDEHWTPIFQGLLSRNCCQVHLPTKPTIHIPFYDLVFYFRKKKHKRPCITKAVLRKSITLPDFKLRYEDTVIKNYSIIIKREKQINKADAKPRN